MTNTQKTILVIAMAVLAGGMFFLVREKAGTPGGEMAPAQKETTANVPAAPEEEKQVTAPAQPVNAGPKEGQEYYNHVMTTTAVQKELEQLVGKDNVMAVLQTNRIDAANIKAGMTLVIPTTFGNASRSPFPAEVAALAGVPKILLFNQRVQAFGAYESGKLVRWGSISSGKQSTKTPNGLFSANWKGREVKSSFDDEWILKYNVNIENFEGIGFHQYAMPGYPASHSCVRMHMDDAMWLYDWADQWVLAPDGQVRLAHGTPVILFGDYAFGKAAPWKLLPEDPGATDVSLAEITAVAEKNTAMIMERQAQRAAALGTVQ